MRGTVVLVLAGLIAPGCGDDAVSTCVPGMTIACPCAGGRTGSQTCRDDGTFGPCQCLDDAGGADAAGTDAAGTDAAGSDAGADAGSDAACTDAGPAACDPLEQDCAAGACYLSAEGAVCSDDGVKIAHERCTVQEDCSPGLTCVRSEGGTFFCERTCDHAAHPEMGDGDHCLPAEVCCGIAGGCRYGVCIVAESCGPGREIAPLRAGG